MWSTSISALEPSSVTICPLTETMPPEIIFSALRREVIPAAEMIFCRRSEGMYREGYQEVTGDCSRVWVPFVHTAESRLIGNCQGGSHEARRMDVGSLHSASLAADPSDKARTNERRNSYEYDWHVDCPAPVKCRHDAEPKARECPGQYLFNTPGGFEILRAASVCRPREHPCPPELTPQNRLQPLAGRSHIPPRPASASYEHSTPTITPDRSLIQRRAGHAVFPASTRAESACVSAVSEGVSCA